MAFWLNVYYIVVLAWTIYYLYHSFSSILPWSHCGNAWNTLNCVASNDFKNFSMLSNQSVSSALEFWE
jgi:solute carrier family 6 (neurotransmitter transporter, GABA) member 1